MDQPNNGPNIPNVPNTLNPMVTAEITQQTQTQQLVKAMEQMEHNKNRRKVTRRVLLGAAGAGAGVGAVALATIAVEKAGNYTKQELDQALQNGIAQGREELLAELRNIEGIGLDAAIAIAKITKFAVQYIVKPLADLNSAIEGDIIASLASGVAQAQVILSGIPFVPSGAIKALNNLQALLRTWHASVTQDVLGQYAVQDVTAAEAYLEALQQKINSGSK
jgi:hypothetical protein